MTSGQTLQEAVRAGRYSVLKHVRRRAAERGFTREQTIQLLSSDALLAWRVRGGVWLVTQPAQPEQVHQLHLRLKLTRSGKVLMLSGWLADPRRALRRWAGRELEAAA